MVSESRPAAEAVGRDKAATPAIATQAGSGTFETTNGVPAGWTGLAPATASHDESKPGRLNRGMRRADTAPGQNLPGLLAPP